MNYKITENKLEIEYDGVALAYMEHGHEIIIPPNSIEIKNKIIKALSLNQLNKLIVLSYFVGNGFYNAITDKKGIWGLTNQAQGLFSNNFLFSKGKVYFGITNNDIEFENSIIYAIFLKYIFQKIKKYRLI